MDLWSLLENTLTGLGYELVEIELFNGNGIRVLMDKQPDGISIDDCVAVSNQLTRLFTVENVDYSRLEVSSPGLDRPLKKEADFVRYIGSKVKIRTKSPVAGRKKITGLLVGVENLAVMIEAEGEVIQIPLADIEKARLEPEF